MDPMILTVLVAGCLFGMGYLLGRGFLEPADRKDQIINSTIVYLAQEGYIRYHIDSDGEMAIYKLKDRR